MNTTETTTSGSMSAVQEHVINAFAQHHISIPYPVQEVKIYRNEQDEQNSGRKQAT